MARSKDRIATGGGNDLSQANPFDGLSGLGLPDRPVTGSKAEPANAPQRRKESLVLRRLKAGKGGKVVTEVSGFDADPGTLQSLLKALQGQLGTGGTCKGKVIELQGECRDRVRPLLESRGYRVRG